jgi:hypothetical protein
VRTAEKLSNYAGSIEPMNDDYDPTEAEEAVLDIFKRERDETGESRLNPYYIRQETDLGKGSVNTALSNLRAAGWMQRVTRGLYEFVDDPRQTQDDGDIDEELAGGPTGQGMDDDEAAAAADRHMNARSDDGVTADDVREQLRDMDLPGSGRSYDQRVEAISTIWQELRANPGQKMWKSDFEDLLSDTDTGYGSFGSLWSNWVKSNPAQGHAENTLTALPGVEMDGDAYVYYAEE